MSEKKSDRTAPETPEQEQRTFWSTLPNWLQALVLFFWEIVERIFTTIRSLVFLLLDTVLMILPSVALTSRRDDEEYSRKIRDQMTKIIQELNLDKSQERIILQNWMGQIGWTNNRATRERNANELIRWWQIILGVLIPVLNSLGPTETVFGTQLAVTTVVSFIGVFVAILTAIAQFRRPEERWRHYRRVTENYQGEMWDFIALSGEIYVTESGQRITSHREAFTVFNQRMSKIRQDDLANFFGESNISSKPMDMEELKKQLDAYESLQVRIRTRQPHVVPSSDVAGTAPTVG
jgi:archaellum biogenesis protein FlaJ (TadC family)